MKDTSLTYFHLEKGAKMTPFAGYNMPLEYSGVITEHLAVRNFAGIFDVSHMGEFWVKGEGAFSLLQKLTTNDLSSLQIGQAQYTCFPNGRGGIVDDLIIYKYEELKYLVVVNAANIKKDFDWIVSHNSEKAELEDASNRMSLIALQGPKAQVILQSLTEYDLESIKNFHFVTTNIAKMENVIVSATGYTGAGGFELYCENTQASNLWEAIISKGEPYGLIPAGLAARDTLRLEMGYSLYGNDIDDTTSPIEAGLGWIVKFVDGNNFIDRDILQKQKAEGVNKKLVGLKIVGRGIPRHGYVVVDENEEEIGIITSGTISPVIQKGIGLAYVKTEFASLGSKVFIKVRNKSIEAEVTKIPFI